MQPQREQFVRRKMSRRFCRQTCPAGSGAECSLSRVSAGSLGLESVAATCFSRPVEIPDDLGEDMAAPVTGRVRLPNRIAWSGQGAFSLSRWILGGRSTRIAGR